ncbi:hypothetical protein [Humidisolicoccus flavus]|uniref:hypothetical protein n=1 Tax=Humidisolicoccus flavus TaxID=3111414 RepID=UPI00324301C3
MNERSTLRSPRTRTLMAGAATIAAASLLTGCTMMQDAFQFGEREFTFATAEDANGSSESFRFQGFLPDDASDIRLVAELDGHAAVMRWNSPTVYESDLCTEVSELEAPKIEADWMIETLPDEGLECGRWTIIRDGGTQFAWSNGKDE